LYAVLVHCWIEVMFLSHRLTSISYPDRNFCPKAGPKPCGWCGGHRGISKMSHCEPLFEYVTYFSSCRIRHFLLPLVEVSDASRFYFLAPSWHLENFGETVFVFSRQSLILKSYKHLYLQKCRHEFVAHLYSTGVSPRRSGFDPRIRFHSLSIILLVCSRFM
jgi:hypothetical protein